MNWFISQDTLQDRPRGFGVAKAEIGAPQILYARIPLNVVIRAWECLKAWAIYRCFQSRSEDQLRVAFQEGHKAGSHWAQEVKRFQSQVDADVNDKSMFFAGYQQCVKDMSMTEEPDATP